MAGIYRQWSCLQLCQVCQSASSSLLTLFGISASHSVSALGIWIVSSKWCSFPALSVEEGHDSGDMWHLHGDLLASLSELHILLLSLNDLSLCLEDLLCYSLSCHSFTVGELLLWLEDDFLLLVESGGVLGDLLLVLEASPPC